MSFNFTLAISTPTMHNWTWNYPVFTDSSEVLDLGLIVCQKRRLSGFVQPLEPLAQAQRKQQATRRGLAVRGTFSPAWRRADWSP